MSPAFGYPAKDHALAWRPAMRIWIIVIRPGLIGNERLALRRTKCTGAVPEGGTRFAPSRLQAIEDPFVNRGTRDAAARRCIRSRFLDLAAGAIGDAAAGGSRRRGGEGRAAGTRRGD